MATLTVQIDEKLKKSVAKKAKKNEMSLSFLFQQLFKSYLKNEIEVGIYSHDEEIARLTKELEEAVIKHLKGKKLPSLEEQLADI